jgi:hypothetical protein
MYGEGLPQPRQWGESAYVRGTDPLSIGSNLLALFEMSH